MLNKKIEEALNAQINAELWSAYLYLSMAAYAHANGNPGMIPSIFMPVNKFTKYCK